jgi:hypothetical protein
MTEPTESDIQHGVDLLTQTENWDGKFASVPIDPVCRWQLSCGKPVENVIVLRGVDNVDVLALCEYHTQCMVAAVMRWRSRD